MVREIPSNQKQVKRPVFGAWITTRRISAALFLSAAVLSYPAIAKAESLASKNREGNRLFSEGKYEEAEKAYLEAQVKSPGKPEILYNLGNSLIRQGKHTQGIQALGQSADKGETRLKRDSLYNTGNGLYETGDYKGSAEAFIETLKLDPEDEDAKHNLELALQKLQEQEQKQSDPNEDQQDSKDQEEDQSEENKGDQQQPNGQDRKPSDNQSNQEDASKMQPDTPDRREGSMTEEQAQKILDAMQNQELEQQRRKMESYSSPNNGGQDW